METTQPGVPNARCGVQMIRPTINGTNVTVQALATAREVPRRVLITPIINNTVPSQHMIEKVLVRCASKDKNKKESNFHYQEH